MTSYNSHWSYHATFARREGSAGLPTGAEATTGQAWFVEFRPAGNDGTKAPADIQYIVILIQRLFSKTLSGPPGLTK